MNDIISVNIQTHLGFKNKDRRWSTPVKTSWNTGIDSAKRCLDMMGASWREVDEFFKG